MDSFVHRAGRTARKGKDGLNILFFKSSELSTVLKWEEKLNLNIKIVNSIDSVSDESSDDQHLSRLHKHMGSSHQLKVDLNASQKIMEALIHPNVPAD